MNKEAILNSKRLITLISCLTGIALTFSGLSIFSLFELNKWIGVSIGTGVFVVCAIIAITVRKKAYIAVILLNSVTMGIAISSLYAHFNFFPPVWQTALVAVGTDALFCIFCLLSKTPLFKNHCVICCTVFLLTILTAEIVCAVLVSPYVFGFALFIFLTLAAHNIVLTAKIKTFDDLIKNLAICSFTVLILAIIVVIIVLSQGDGADGVGDLLSGASPSKSTKQKRDPYNFEMLK